METQNCKNSRKHKTKILRNAIGPALLALGAAGVALTPVPTQAADFSGRSQRVSLVGLDLNSVEGARKAYTRINAAAWSVCGESSMDIEVMVRGPSECVKDAIARAVIGVRSAELSKLYIKRNGIQMAALHGVTSPIVTAENLK